MLDNDCGVFNPKAAIKASSNCTEHQRDVDSRKDRYKNLSFSTRENLIICLLLYILFGSDTYSANLRE